MNGMANLESEKTKRAEIREAGKTARTEALAKAGGETGR